MTGRMAFHAGSVKKTVRVKTSKQAAWLQISKIASLSWLAGVKSAKHCSNTRSGTGAIRSILFSDGNTVREHIVGWRRDEYFSYVAVSGLPVGAYHATISLTDTTDGVQITWQSYFNDSDLTGAEFSKFVEFLSSFYSDSLANLKRLLEAR